MSVPRIFITPANTEKPLPQASDGQLLLFDSEKPTEKPPQPITSGVIARQLGVPTERVRYILRTRPHIKPVELWPVYSQATVDLVRRELLAQDARWPARRPGTRP